MNNKFWFFLGCSLAILIMCILFIYMTPIGRAFFNTWDYSVQKVDDATNYKKKKQVEDTCRSMISSYKSDVLTYEQYIDSDNEEEKGWANQAKMRANKTASSYNEYILKNSYIWKGNVPNDILSELPII